MSESHPSGCDTPDLSIALSGGGHRAALFAVGAVLGITDAGLNARTAVISSVSGGSITNGLVARGCDFQNAGRADIEGVLRPGVAAFSKDGLFFPGPSTNGFVRAFFTFGGLALAALASLMGHASSIGRDAGWSTALMIALVTTVVLELVALVVCWKAKVPGTFRVGLAVGLLATMAMAPAIRFAHHDQSERAISIAVLVAVVVVTFGLFTLTVRWFGRRGEAVDKALHEDLFEGATLAGLADPAKRPVHHVFCSTNLHSGTQAYLTPRLVSGHLMGTGRPSPKLRLSTAVQCSAAFPGGFNARRLDPADLFDLAQPVVEVNPPNAADLVDGGVYDNMGDQWEFGWANRQERLSKADASLTDYGAAQSKTLLVVNAGGHYGTGPIKGHGLRREIGALVKDKSVMYDQTTAVKRRYLRSAFISGRPLAGAMVQIGQSPYDVPRDIVGNETAPVQMRERAKAALYLLDSLGSPRAGQPTDQAWEAVAKENAAVPTVLSPIVEARAVELILHAYVLTRVNTYVLLGHGALPADAGSEWSHSRFQQFVATSAGAGNG